MRPAEPRAPRGSSPSRSGLLTAALVAASCVACQAAAPSSAKDVDGNSYRVVRLGTQNWFAENLRATRTPAGARMVTFAPDDDTSNVAAFGRLYPWDSARRGCPSGWHLPSDSEWTSLERFLGGAAAQRLRDPAYWPAGTPVSADRVPFDASPAGYSNDQGFDNFFGTRAVFWTATPEDGHFVWSRVLLSDQPALRRAPQHPQYGFSVRCVGNDPVARPS